MESAASAHSQYIDLCLQGDEKKLLILEKCQNCFHCGNKARHLIYTDIKKKIIKSLDHLKKRDQLNGSFILILINTNLLARTLLSILNVHTCHFKINCLPMFRNVWSQSYSFTANHIETFHHHFYSRWLQQSLKSKCRSGRVQIPRHG